MSMIAQARLERRINWGGIAVIIGLITNLCAGSWYASNLSSRVGTLEVAYTKRDADHELLVRMDERTRVMAVDISDIKKRLAAR